MPQGCRATFICPACGESEILLPEGRDPQEIPYTELAELDTCEQGQRGVFIYGNGYTRGFGGVVIEEVDEGGVRERWVPPRAVIAYRFYSDRRYLARSEPTPICFTQPLFRNRVLIDGLETINVAVTFLPHGEVHTPEMRARGEQLAKALG